jgi:hypothetical protein
MDLIMVSFMEHPYLFQEFQPIAGVRPRPLFRE